jgi:hypothetical protein
VKIEFRADLEWERGLGRQNERFLTFFLSKTQKLGPKGPKYEKNTRKTREITQENCKNS